MLLKNITTSLAMLLAMSLGATGVLARSLDSKHLIKKDSADVPQGGGIERPPCTNDSDCTDWGNSVCSANGWCLSGYCCAACLWDTVLPNIDNELEQGCLIPAVQIEDALHPDWRLLGDLGVIIAADVHYYLRCLGALAGDAAPDISKVAYIYEKIQSHYRGNEKVIRYVVLTTALEFQSSG
ncbi:hypothetical protein B0T25DRAFT_576782 [Lasiosphaeria hispida]|uniref:WAP domain-containing protein n=1 Tax=Lasiosphaeria hispida TaxID=260671 RepID=A0AAJ0HXS3_9PEZI|nr:hypothetical protein B0T25DRAFT_576782 [Lasiosphaeria hispida]